MKAVTTTTSGQAQFDYTQLAGTDAQELRLIAERVRLRLKRTAEDIIAIGKELKHAQAELADYHGGTFLAWIAAEFDMKQRTAYNFIAVAQRFGDSLANIANLGPTALYMLAAPSTSDEIVAGVTSGEIPATAAAIKAAKEAAKKAREESEIVKRELWKVRNEAQEIDLQRQQAEGAVRQQEKHIALLRQELEELRAAASRDTGQETVVEYVERVPDDISAKMADLERQIAAYQAQAADPMHQVRERWQSAHMEVVIALRAALADLPTTSDAACLDPADWQGISECKSLACQLVEAIDRLRMVAASVVDA